MTSPSTTLAITDARMSGTAAKICSQFDRTWARPLKLRRGWAGVSLR